MTQCKNPYVGYMPYHDQLGVDRRTEPRFRINEPAILKSQIGGIAAVRALDISVGGLRITAPGPLPLNTQVEINLGGTRVCAVVRHCKCIRATEFQLGLSAVASADGQTPARLDHLPAYRRARSINGGVAAEQRASYVPLQRAT